MGLGGWVGGGSGEAGDKVVCCNARCTLQTFVE